MLHRGAFVHHPGVDGRVISWWGKLLQVSGVTLGHSFGVGHKLCDRKILFWLYKVISTSIMILDRANGVIYADCQKQGVGQGVGLVVN